MVLARPPFNTGDRVSLLEGPTTKHKTQHARLARFVLPMENHVWLTSSFLNYWTEALPRAYQTREFRSQDAESPCGRITETLAVAMAGQQYVGSR
ncbi:hypothetical protein HZH68_015043 [Vespula germanica]|uniref:Uncharacterized protein n=2 Tax=Vespula TaxID=7451 RepID=A0A834MTK4_VESGE|nr:hypothetical protein HZH68_015043 [Vespula germanica]KAF7398272.1 hypothetical protein H0235_016280 [Vespula pensylvanica]